MAKLRLHAAASRQQTFYVKLLDNTSTSGAGKTGLVHTDVSLAYVPYRGLSLPLTLNGSLSTPDQGFSAGGFIEVEATRHPGLYRIDIDDSAFTTAPSVILTVTGAGIVDVDAEYQLDDMSEPAAASIPADEVMSMEEKVNWIFKKLFGDFRSNTTTQTIRNRADSADLATSTISDAAGTTTRGQFS